MERRTELPTPVWQPRRHPPPPTHINFQKVEKLIFSFTRLTSKSYKDMPRVARGQFNSFHITLSPPHDLDAIDPSALTALTSGNPSVKSFHAVTECSSKWHVHIVVTLKTPQRQDVFRRGVLNILSRVDGYDWAKGVNAKVAVYVRGLTVAPRTIAFGYLAKSPGYKVLSSDGWTEADKEAGSAAYEEEVGFATLRSYSKTLVPLSRDKVFPMLAAAIARLGHNIRDEGDLLTHSEEGGAYLIKAGFAFGSSINETCGKGYNESAYFNHGQLAKAQADHFAKYCRTVVGELPEGITRFTQGVRDVGREGAGEQDVRTRPANAGAGHESETGSSEESDGGSGGPQRRRTDGGSTGISTYFPVRPNPEARVRDREVEDGEPGGGRGDGDAMGHSYSSDEGGLSEESRFSGKIRRARTLVRKRAGRIRRAHVKSLRRRDVGVGGGTKTLGQRARERDLVEGLDTTVELSDEEEPFLRADYENPESREEYEARMREMDEEMARTETDGTDEFDRELLNHNGPITASFLEELGKKHGKKVDHGLN